MKKKHLLELYTLLLIVGLGALSFGLANCSGNPSSPNSAPTATPTCNGPCPPTATFTSTASPTVTITPTRTVTPTCGSYTDISANIDGTDLTANDTGHTLPSFVLLDQGGTTTGDIYTFTLTSSKVLNFSLCPTEDPSRDITLYVRPSCWNNAGESYNSGYCDLLPEIQRALPFRRNLLRYRFGKYRFNPRQLYSADKIRNSLHHLHRHSHCHATKYRRRNLYGLLDAL